MAAARILWMIVWVLLLIFVTFWVASFAAFWYILIAAFVPCVPALKGVIDILHRGVLLPYFCSDNIVNGRDLNDGVKFACSGPLPSATT